MYTILLPEVHLTDVGQIFVYFMMMEKNQHWDFGKMDTWILLKKFFAVFKHCSISSSGLNRGVLRRICYKSMTPSMHVAFERRNYRYSVYNFENCCNIFHYFQSLLSKANHWL